MSILISEKVDIIAKKKKKNTRNRYGHSIKMKMLIKQEDIAILNTLASNNRFAKCRAKNLIEMKKVDKSIIIGETSPLTQWSIEQLNRKLAKV